jgi:ribosomal protein S8
LKYDKDTKESVIKDIQRISKPGLRKYSSSASIPRILTDWKWLLFYIKRFDDRKKAKHLMLVVK